MKELSTSIVSRVDSDIKEYYLTIRSEKHRVSRETYLLADFNLQLWENVHIKSGDTNYRFSESLCVKCARPQYSRVDTKVDECPYCRCDRLQIEVNYFKSGDYCKHKFLEGGSFRCDLEKTIQ